MAETQLWTLPSSRLEPGGAPHPTSRGLVVTLRGLVRNMQEWAHGIYFLFFIFFTEENLILKATPNSKAVLSNKWEEKHFQLSNF